MHRNTFLQSPGLLDGEFRMISRPDTFFAGQMTGVEGYVESAASGLAAGVALARQLRGLPPLAFPGTTAIGALGRYISSPNADFQPMNITFGLIDPLETRVRGKAQRYEAISARSIALMRDLSARIDE